MKVLFVAQNLAIGGIQTSLANLLHKMCSTNEYEIDLFTFTSGVIEQQIPKDVNIIKGKKLLSLASTSFADVKKSRNIVKIILRIMVTVYARVIGSERFYRQCFNKQRLDKKYDVAISFFNDVADGCFNKGTNLYVSDYADADERIAWIHNDPILMGFDKEVCKKAYPPFDRIVCVSNAVKEKFDEFLPGLADKTEVIYNFFQEDAIQKKADEYIPFEKCGCDIVTVGRTDPVAKRTDKILELCKRLKDDGVSNFCWRLVGGGPELQRLKQMADELGVCDVVVFEGEKENPYPYIKHSDLFALYSAYEGFPMVIGETMILGTYILTANYAAAAEQIPEKCGKIAEDDEIFYKYLKDYISSTAASAEKEDVIKQG